MEKKKTLVKYEATSRGYDELYGEEQRKKYFKALSKINCKGMKILDAGCGTGLLEEEIQGACLLVAADFSRNMIRKALKRVKGRWEVELLIADIENPPIKDESFNIFFLITVVQNLTNPIEAIKKIGMKMKKHGMGVISIPKRIFSEEEMRMIILKSGLKIHERIEDKNVKDTIFIVST